MATVTEGRNAGVLGAIERIGNRLPDPVFIFVCLIGILIVVNTLAALIGLRSIHPVSGEPVDFVLETSS